LGLAASFTKIIAGVRLNTLAFGATSEADAVVVVKLDEVNYSGFG
jgi:hypothetical protein